MATARAYRIIPQQNMIDRKGNDHHFQQNISSTSYTDQVANTACRHRFATSGVSIVSITSSSPIVRDAQQAVIDKAVRSVRGKCIMVRRGAEV